MNVSVGLGLSLILMGGLLEGSFSLPMKSMPDWRWENTWLVYSIVGLVIIPWTLALTTVPRLDEVFHLASWPTLIRVTLFGFGWGIGSTLFGLGIVRVGLALGFAIILGITAAFGSLLPLAVLQPQKLWSPEGFALIVGLLIAILGVAFCAIAGRQREREMATLGHPENRSSFWLGLVICIFSGIFSSMLNFSFVFGTELQHLARSLGASQFMAANPIWSLALGGGFIANGAYCVYLSQKNRTWIVLVRREIPVIYWLGGSLMGLLWFGGILAYGAGAGQLGNMGGIWGLPLFMAMTIIAANLWGALTGEWKGASNRSVTYSWAGIGILLIAIYVISRGGLNAS